MLYHLNLDHMEGRWVVFVAELPGCFVSLPAQQDALDAVPETIESHLRWLREHGEQAPDGAIETTVSEIHEAWRSDPDYEVNAFFATDRPPLEQTDVDEALRLLTWTRQELLEAVEGVSDAGLSRDVEDGWSIRRILRHQVTAERFYLDRLDLAMPDEELPEDALERSQAVRVHLLDIMPRLVGDASISTPRFELWSPRKLVRRALWHERDHTAHILQFRRRLRV